MTHLGRYGHAVVGEQHVACLVASMHVVGIERDEVAGGDAHATPVEVEVPFAFFDAADDVMPMRVRREGLREPLIRSPLAADLGDRGYGAVGRSACMPLLAHRIQDDGAFEAVEPTEPRSAPFSSGPPYTRQADES